MSDKGDKLLTTVESEESGTVHEWSWTFDCNSWQGEGDSADLKEVELVATAKSKSDERDDMDGMEDDEYGDPTARIRSTVDSADLQSVPTKSKNDCKKIKDHDNFKNPKLK